jgi:hypothetical protein
MVYDGGRWQSNANDLSSGESEVNPVSLSGCLQKVCIVMIQHRLQDIGYLRVQVLWNITLGQTVTICRLPE